MQEEGLAGGTGPFRFGHVDATLALSFGFSPKVLAAEKDARPVRIKTRRNTIFALLTSVSTLKEYIFGTKKDRWWIVES